MMNFPVFHTSSHLVNRAYRVAMADLIGNIRPFQDGLLEEPKPVLLAGLDYDTPWTRDAAINVWNGVGLVWPDVARDTLLAVLEKTEQGTQIGGQYWDAIIWTIGAWAYSQYSGDREFMSLALDAVRNSLKRFEKEEFDSKFGLFRGPAVYGDGVAAYPDVYSPGTTSSILDWVKVYPDKAVPVGYGLPMMSLSTNCVYYEAYRLAQCFADELGEPGDPTWVQKAAALKERIQDHFWNVETGTFKYLVDRWGGCDAQEGLGHSFALLFGLADARQAESLFTRQVISPAGIPCVWPTFQRYSSPNGQRFGRHSGTVWPLVQGFWAEAAARYGKGKAFLTEFDRLSEHINHDAQCVEIYHPLTGAVYGGIQEGGGGPDGLQWASCNRQSWSASAYLRMILTGILGMRFSTQGIEFQPYLPGNLEQACLTELPYRNSTLDIRVTGQGRRIVSARLNGQESKAFIAADALGLQTLEIEVK
jgi:glycogen debranching enzyme